MKARGAGFGKSDLEALAEAQQIPMGFWDPLKLADQEFWGQSQEATIGFLRHAEIKHGRVAMAAFVGYIVQANGLVFPWAIQGGPLAGVGPFEGIAGETVMFSDIAAAGAPMAQWDALPSAAKLQILGTIFILEWIGETPQAGAEPHYMRGGKPGYFPSLKEAKGVPHPVPFDLFNPFGLLPEQTAEQKARGLNVAHRARPRRHPRRRPLRRRLHGRVQLQHRRGPPLHLQAVRVHPAPRGRPRLQRRPVSGNCMTRRMARRPPRVREPGLKTPREGVWAPVTPRAARQAAWCVWCVAG